jgi:hypothetical protein
VQLLLVSVGRTQRVGLLLATGELDIAKPTWMIVAYPPRTAIVEYCSYIFIIYREFSYITFCGPGPSLGFDLELYGGPGLSLLGEEAAERLRLNGY